MQALLNDVMGARMAFLGVFSVLSLYGLHWSFLYLVLYFLDTISPPEGGTSMIPIFWLFRYVAFFVA
jgi:hypothetical protein